MKALTVSDLNVTFRKTWEIFHVVNFLRYFSGFFFKVCFSVFLNFPNFEFSSFFKFPKLSSIFLNFQKIFFNFHYLFDFLTFSSTFFGFHRFSAILHKLSSIFIDFHKFSWIFINFLQKKFLKFSDFPKVPIKRRMK